jgi:ribonuclease J
MAIVSVRNNLAEIGCKTINNKQLDIHVSGHAHAEECKLMTTLLNPKYFTPIHGEFYMRYAHRDLVVSDLQIKEENTFMMENGRGVILSAKGARLMTKKECVAGTEKLVQLGEIVHDKLLEERKLLSENGIILIVIESEKGRLKKLEIKSKGFIHMNQKHEIFTVLEKEIKALWVRTYDPSRPEKALEDPIRIHTEKYFLQRFRREQLVSVLVY